MRIESLHSTMAEVVVYVVNWGGGSINCAAVMMGGMDDWLHSYASLFTVTSANLARFMHV